MHLFQSKEYSKYTMRSTFKVYCTAFVIAMKVKVYMHLHFHIPYTAKYNQSILHLYTAFVIAMKVKVYMHLHCIQEKCRA